jgi:hypothetical protein
MCKISDQTGSAGTSSVGRKDSASKSDTGRKAVNPSELHAKIRAANRKVRLLDVLNQYGIKIVRSPRRDWSYNIICPLKSHKGANERTASFAYCYKDDHFSCLGCRAAGHAVEFIAGYTGKPRGAIADAILSRYSEDVVLEEYDDHSPEIEKALFDLSDFVRQIVCNDPCRMPLVDKVMWWFDSYLAASAAQGKIVVEDLEYRAKRVKELLSGRQ